MKTTYGNLRRLVQEALKPMSLHEGILHEASNDVDPGSDSLDTQVDKYFAEYETEAKNTKNEGYSVRAVMSRLITEADDDVNAEEPKKDDASPDAAAPEKLGLDSIDVASFANSVIRLVDNYDSLLEVRDTIVSRGISFLKKTYGDDVVKGYTDALRDQHGIVPGKSKMDVNDDEFPAPVSDRAGGGEEGGGAP
jgi:hypothetical protein